MFLVFPFTLIIFCYVDDKVTKTVYVYTSNFDLSEWPLVIPISLLGWVLMYYIKIGPNPFLSNSYFLTVHDHLSVSFDVTQCLQLNHNWTSFMKSSKKETFLCGMHLQVVAHHIWEVSVK